MSGPEDLHAAVRAGTDAHLLAVAERLERVCEQALAGGQHGVGTDGEDAWVDARVPYGRIGYGMQRREPVSPRPFCEADGDEMRFDAAREVYTCPVCRGEVAREDLAHLQLQVSEEPFVNVDLLEGGGVVHGVRRVYDRADPYAAQHAEIAVRRRVARVAGVPRADVNVEHRVRADGSGEVAAWVRA